MLFEESVRTADLLRESNVNVCGIIVNRMLPDNLTGVGGPADFYQARQHQEQIYCEEIRRRFAQYPSIWIPQFETDIYGIKNLERLSEMLASPNNSAPFR